jgi:hypothetical protein
MALLVTDAEARKLVVSDRRVLAPKMEDRVRDMEVRALGKGHVIRVYETGRSHTLARMYHALGASKSPDGWRTWHFYFLAADIIHPTRGWNAWEATDQAAEDWRGVVVEAGKAAGLDWGGDWVSFKDRPHWQFGTVKPSPSDEAIRLYKDEGIVELWRVCGAL